MPRFGALRAASVACIVALIAILSTVPASAATLTAVRVDAQPTGGSLVTVSFTGGVPVYHVLGAGTSETSVLFDTTTLGTVPPSVSGAGAINSVSVAQTGVASSVALHLSSATPVRVRTSGSNVFIDVSPAPNQAGFPLTQPPVPTAIGLGPITEVVPLKYADVSEIAGVLVANSNVTTNDTFSPVQTNIGTSSLSGSFGGVSGGTSIQQPTQTFGGGAFGAAATGVAQRVNDNIAIDRRLNAIVLSGTAEVVAGLHALIDKLDIPVPSVILETQIVELSDTAARNIGLDFSPDGSGIVVDATRSTSTTTGTTTNTGGLTFGTQQQGTASASLQAALYAQVSQGNGRVIAKPRILAQSGQQASILTGDAIPIITQVLVANSGSGSSVSYVNVGVNLQILPRVSSDGFVTSHIYSEVSSVTGYTSGVPQISQRTASTLATVRDGDSFVIGGLLQDSELRNLSKLPFIGDIPLIGQFFRHVSTSHSQTNLYIVVTPHVIAPGSSAPSPAIQPLAVPAPLPQVSAPPAPGAGAASPGPLTPPRTVSTPRPH